MKPRVADFRMALRTILAGTAGLGLLSGVAQADVISGTFTPASSNPDTGDFVFTVTGGTVTGISGNVDGVAIVGLDTGGTQDNLYPIDSNGIAFDLASAVNSTTHWMIYKFSSDQDALQAIGGNGSYGSFAVTSVPEPSSTILLGTAVAGLLAGSARRRRKTAAAAA